MTSRGSRALTASSSARRIFPRRWGILGNSGHADVRAAIDDAIRRTAAAGKAAGSLTGDAALAQHWFAQGLSFIAAGAEFDRFGERRQRGVQHVQGDCREGSRLIFTAIPNAMAKSKELQ